MKIYAFPPSPNARKVQAVAAHLGVAYDFVMVDLTKGEQKRPEYMKLNLNGRMPTLVDGDFVLWESNAIMQYLATKVPNTLWPAGERVRADIARWQFWELAHWGPACGIFLFENLVKSLLGIGPPDPAQLKVGAERFATSGAVLDAHLAGREWLTDSGLTLADFSVGSYLGAAEVCQFPWRDFANLRGWFARLAQTEGWTKSEPQRPGHAGRVMDERRKSRAMRGSLAGEDGS